MAIRDRVGLKRRPLLGLVTHLPSGQRYEPSTCSVLAAGDERRGRNFYAQQAAAGESREKRHDARSVAIL